MPIFAVYNENFRQMDKPIITKIALILLLLVAFGRAQAQIVKGEVFFGGNACQVDGDECFGFNRLGFHAGAGALVPITSFMDIGLEVLFNQKGAFKKWPNTSNSTYPYAYDLRLNYAEVPLMIYFTDKDILSLGIGVSYGRLVGLSEKNGHYASTESKEVVWESTGIGMGDGKLHWKDEYEGQGLPAIDKVQSLDELATIFYEQAGFADTLNLTNFINNSSTYNPNDFCICADFRCRIWNGIHAELRYQYSLGSIRTRMFYENWTMTLPNQIRLQYNSSLTLRIVYIFNEHRSKSNKNAQKAGAKQSN